MYCLALLQRVPALEVITVIAPSRVVVNIGGSFLFFLGEQMTGTCQLYYMSVDPVCAGETVRYPSRGPCTQQVEDYAFFPDDIIPPQTRPDQGTQGCRAWPSDYLWCIASTQVCIRCYVSSTLLSKGRPLFNNIVNCYERL